MGLANNLLLDIQFVHTIPWIISLDISYNHLVSLQQTVEALAKLPELRILYMIGNVFCLQKEYRKYTCKTIPQLLHLDEQQVELYERESQVAMQPTQHVTIAIAVEKLIIRDAPVAEDEKSKKPNSARKTQKSELTTVQPPVYEKKYAFLS